VALAKRNRTGADHVNPQQRRRFDEHFEWVLESLPPMIHELIERVPLHVEDYPSDEVMDRTGVEYIDDLCGLYTGIPIGEKSISHSGTMPDVVTIYREGILSAAADRRGRISTENLRKQIRITILHELAHHHGLTEEDLRSMGYG
jgi:predicted Zn-dependent protease with MMP-like domain